MEKLDAAGIAKVGEVAMRLGTQDAEVVRQAMCPGMSKEHWAELMHSAWILT